MIQYLYFCNAGILQYNHDGVNVLLDPVGTVPVCCNENLQWIGGGFGRYGSFGEEDALVGVGGC